MLFLQLDDNVLFSRGNALIFTLCVVSAIVTGETVNEIYSRVKDVIRSHSGPVIWITARHPL